MSRRPGMTHDEHVLHALKSRAARAYVDELWSITVNKFGKSHPLSKAMERTRNAYIKAQSELDREYHRVTSHDEFMKDGHVYYRGPEHAR